VNGQWPAQPWQAVRRRYWRRPLARVFPTASLLPIEILPPSGRWPRRTPLRLKFTDRRDPRRTMTVRMTLGGLEHVPGLLTRVNTELSGAPWPPHLKPLEPRAE
jgi:hypothetical protein